MDDSDTLPDIVQNQLVPDVDNVCIFNNELHLSQSSPIPLDAEMSNNEEFRLITPHTPDELGTAAVSAAMENTTGTKSVCEITIPNKDTLLTMDKTKNTEKKLPGAMVNNSRSKVTATMSKETINETKTPPPLPSTGGDNKNPEIWQTTALDNITEDVTVLNESPEQNDTLLGVMVSNDGIVNSNEVPMDVDINNEPSETLHGVTMTGNVATVPLHGVTDLNSFDHSYSRQTNDSLIINPDYYATTEDEDDAIEGLFQLSAADNTRADFPGDNSQLLPIGTRIPDTTAIDINLETVAVTAAIENIALEETVSKTTNTVSTQTTFTRQRHNQPVELSDLDTDDDWSKKPITHS